MEKIRAVQINGYGGSEILQVNNEVELPELAADAVLVSVIAAGINPFDWKLREGYMKESIPLNFPFTMGADFAGIVRQKGNHVQDFKVGDEVFGQAGKLQGGSGAWAQQAIAKIDKIALKPARSNFLEAAGLPLVGVSAWQALVENIGVKNGEKILIHGGAGGIGLVAIQLAKHLGAEVVTTVSQDSVDLVKSLGADRVILKDQPFEEIEKDFDAVLDTVGGKVNEKSYQVLKQGGLLVSMVEQPRLELMDQYGVRMIYQFTQVNSAHLAKVAELVDQGGIKIRIDKIFPLEKTAEAMEHLQHGHPRGKVVITV